MLFLIFLGFSLGGTSTAATTGGFGATTTQAGGLFNNQQQQQQQHPVIGTNNLLSFLFQAIFLNEKIIYRSVLIFIYNF